jgi:hypothetical protein
VIDRANMERIVLRHLNVVGIITGRINKANSAAAVASEVKTAATGAKEAALGTEQNNRLTTFAFSLTGALVFVLALFLIWRRYKKNYVETLFESKPEANN